VASHIYNYVNGIPAIFISSMATFADDTEVMAVGGTVGISTRKLQSALNTVASWTKTMAIKIQRIHIGTNWLYKED
jgi:hypothetical protein